MEGWQKRIFQSLEVTRDLLHREQFTTTVEQVGAASLVLAIQRDPAWLDLGT